MIADSVRQVGVAARRALLARLGQLQTFATQRSAALRSIVLLEHDIAQACEFFRQGLGGRVLVATEGWAEIELGGSGGVPGGALLETPVLIHLKKLDTDMRRDSGDGSRERSDHPTAGMAAAGGTRIATRSAAAASVASSDAANPAPPTMLVFSVEDVQTCLVNMLRHGGHMDGRIEYSPDGTTQAVVRSPGGTSVGIIGT